MNEATRSGLGTTAPNPVSQSLGERSWVIAVVVLAFLLGPVAVAGVAAQSGIPIFWPVYAISVMAMTVVMWRLRRRPLVVVAMVVVWFALHKLLVALLGFALDPQAAAWLQNYKEPMYLAVFVVGAFALIESRRRSMSRFRLPDRVTSADLLAVALVALVGIYFVASAAVAWDDLQSALVYARRFASLPIIFLAGRLLLPDASQLLGALRVLAVVALIVAGFGLLERLILGDGFWTAIVHISQFQASLVDEGFASSRSRLVDGLPANWFSFLEGFRVRRLVSSFLEPTTLALFLALATSVYAIVMKEWRQHPIRWWFALAILAAALVLTIGKAGYLALAIIGVVVLLRTTRKSVRLVVAVVSVVAILAVLVGQFLPFDTNIDRHLRGLFSGVSQVLQHPLGSGLGSTGFWGERGRVGTDSTLGAVASQTGIVGGVLYVTWLLAVAWQLLPTAAGSRGDVQRLMSGAVLALLAVAILSNSASGLLAGFSYMLFAGWTLSAAKATGAIELPGAAEPTRPGLVIGWMPYSRRSSTLAEAVGYRLLLIGRPGFRQAWSAGVLYPILAARSCAAIARHRPSAVIVVAPPFVAPMVIVPLCALLSIPVAVDIHSGAVLDRRWRWSVPLLASITKRATTGIVTLRNLAKTLERYGVRTMVIPDPLPHLTRSSMPPSSAIEMRRPTVIAVCGWGDDEPIDELVEAARGQPWTLLITGRARRRLELPANARLTGFMTDAEYAAVLSKADLVLVLTTRPDTLLSGAWEALSLERPLLVSNTAALRATFGPRVASVDNTAQSIRAAVGARLSDPGAAIEAARLAKRYRIENDRAVSELQQSLARAAG